MKSRLMYESGGLRTFAVVMDKGDDAAAELLRFAAENGVTGAGLTAVGACREATLGYFDPETSRYLDIPVSGQCEVLSFVGDIALDGWVPAVHAHAVLGHRDGAMTGGHVQRMVVWPTLEVIVTETPPHLRKHVDEETGLALVRLEG